MLLPKTVLMKFAYSLKTKSDDQLKGLLKAYEHQLTKINDENSKQAINQKIELLNQEISYREKANDLGL